MSHLQDTSSSTGFKDTGGLSRVVGGVYLRSRVIL